MWDAARGEIVFPHVRMGRALRGLIRQIGLIRTPPELKGEATVPAGPPTRPF